MTSNISSERREEPAHVVHVEGDGVDGFEDVKVVEGPCKLRINAIGHLRG